MLLFAIILALHVANGRVINSIDQIEKRPFGFDDVIQSSKFSMSSFNGTWVSSTAFIYRNRDGSIMKFDIQTGEDTIFLSIDKLVSIPSSSELILWISNYFFLFF